MHGTRTRVGAAIGSERQMLEVLRTHTVQVKEGEYPMGFDVLKRPVAT